MSVFQAFVEGIKIIIEKGRRLVQLHELHVSATVCNCAYKTVRSDIYRSHIILLVKHVFFTSFTSFTFFKSQIFLQQKDTDGVALKIKQQIYLFSQHDLQDSAFPCYVEQVTFESNSQCAGIDEL